MVKPPIVSFSITMSLKENFKMCPLKIAPPPVNFHPLESNILLSALFTIPFDPFSSYMTRDKVSHLQRTNAISIALKQSKVAILPVTRNADSVRNCNLYFNLFH